MCFGTQQKDEGFYFHVGVSGWSHLKLVGETKTKFINMNTQLSQSSLSEPYEI